MTDWSLVAMVFLVPIYFAWFHENYTVFDLNKSVAMRLLLLVGIGAWLAGVSISGKISWRSGRVAAWFALVLGLLFSLSTIFSLHPDISLWGSYERQQGLYNILHYLLFFVLMGVSVTDRKSIERLLTALLAGAGVVCLYGLLQLIGWDFLRWAESGEARIFSTFGQPNFLGHFLVVVLPLTVYGFFWMAARQWQKWLYAVLALLEAVCLVFTYSRSAWLALLVTGIIFVLWLLWHRKKIVASLVISAMVLVSGIAMLAPAVRTAALKAAQQENIYGLYRLVSIFDLDSGSNHIRLNYWKAAVSDFRQASLERKLIGYGPDVQASVYVRYYQPDWAYYEKINSFPDRAHNFVLDIILQFGLLGLLGMIGFVGSIVWRLMARLRREAEGADYWLGVGLLAALLAYGVNNLFSFSLTVMNVMLYGLLAMASLAANNYKAKEGTLSFFQPVSRIVLTAAFVIFLLIVFYGQNVKLLVADYYYMQVKKAEARGNCREVMTNLENVLEWYPANHYYERAYLHHGTNCFSAATTPQARAAMSRNLIEQAESIPDSRKQYYTLIDLSHVYSVMGYYVDKKYYDSAERYYKELIDINPNITTNYQDYGRLKLWQAKYPEAIALFKQGIAAAPSLDEAPKDEHGYAIAQQVAYLHNLVGSVLYEQKKYDEALTWYLRSISIDVRSTASYKKVADIYYQRGNLKEAIRYNRQGYDLEPGVSLWPFGLAVLYKETGDRSTALQYAREAAKIDPADERIKQLVTELETKK